jgi:hypothetical protein
MTSSDVTSVSVKGGEVREFKRVLSKSSRSFTVEFPDGECIAKRVRVSFANGSKSDHPRYNVCSGGGLAVVGR